jgi:hypothetical protein
VFTGLHIAAGTGTTAIKTGEGVLHCISVNTKGTASNILTVTIDGSTMALIDTTAQIQTLFFDLKYVTSLAVTSTTGTGADLTISYL